MLSNVVIAMRSILPFSPALPALSALSTLALGVLVPATALALPGLPPPSAPVVETEPAPPAPIEQAAPPAQPAPPATPASGGVPTFLASTNGEVGWPGAEQARRGVVQIERGGRVIGLGSVLGHDGRVLTSLTVVGSSNDADVRYADGTLAHAKLGHKDAEWDLALLVPQNGPHWTDGLIPSPADPSGATLRAFGPRAPAVPRAPGAPPLPASARPPAGPRATPAPFQGRTDVHAVGGTALEGAMSLSAQGATLGSPVVDSEGSVLAVLVKACLDTPGGSAAAPAPGSAQAQLNALGVGTHPRVGEGARVGAVAAKTLPCSAVMIGAPVRAVRDFLVRTPTTAAAPAPWLGIVGESSVIGAVRGVRVMAVAPGSPADKAGLHASTDATKADMVTAVDGVPVDSPDRLAEEIAKRPIGSKTPLLLFKDGRLKEATVTLRAAP
jgi:S1-C subfamily serine protease